MIASEILSMIDSDFVDCTEWKDYQSLYNKGNIDGISIV